MKGVERGILDDYSANSAYDFNVLSVARVQHDALWWADRFPLIYAKDSKDIDGFAKKMKRLHAAMDRANRLGDFSDLGQFIVETASQEIKELLPLKDLFDIEKVEDALNLARLGQRTIGASTGQFAVR